MINEEEDGEVKLLDVKDVEGFYVFCDIRSFSGWANRNRDEVPQLLEIAYSIAFKVFGGRASQDFLFRVVKFLGDGFFAVREYDAQSHASFRQNLLRTISDMITFKEVFYDNLKSSKLHEKKRLGIGFGLSYGTSRRFHLPGFPVDYAGGKVNLASRLCDEAEASHFLIEYGLKKHILDFVDQGKFKLRRESEKRLEIKGFGSRKAYVLEDIIAMSIDRET